MDFEEQIEVIPRFTKIFKYLKNFGVIVFDIKSNTFIRNLSPWARNNEDFIIFDRLLNQFFSELRTEFLKQRRNELRKLGKVEGTEYDPGIIEHYNVMIWDVPE